MFRSMPHQPAPSCAPGLAATLWTGLPAVVLDAYLG
jgi:hypothetical protein